MNLEKNTAASVVLFSGIERELTYLAPVELGISEGCMVRVPLRGGSACGIVAKLFDASEFKPEKFKLKIFHPKLS